MKYPGRCAAWALAGALLAAPLQVAQARAPGMCLATPDQRESDARSLAILERPDYKQGVEAIAELLRADPLAQDPQAEAAIERDAAAVAYMALQETLSSDPASPRFLWIGDAPHSWHGLDIPWASYGFNNQDDIYRSAGIDVDSLYVISGKVPANPPPQVRFSLFRTQIDEVPEGLDLKDMKIEPDGTFTIVIDRYPANGRANHIRSHPDTPFMWVRDVMNDWSAYNPLELSIRRMGPAPAPMSDEAVVKAAIALAKQSASLWLQQVNPMMIYKPEANAVPEPRGRVGGWGVISNGHFELDDDQALIVTLDPAGAAYVGFQLGDAWSMPLPFVDRMGSLTDGQIAPNPDGTYTYVVSARDPGVHNWLDSAGLARPTFSIRWQGLPEGGLASNPVLGVERVPLRELRSWLPAGMRYVTPPERKAQIENRVADWNRRIGCGR